MNREWSEAVNARKTNIKQTNIKLLKLCIQQGRQQTDKQTWRYTYIQTDQMITYKIKHEGHRMYEPKEETVC